jgi:serine/threonine protein phosphatase PrpC
MNNRVNGKSLVLHSTKSAYHTKLTSPLITSVISGVLAVTRALGDASVKEFVVGNPYTTETRLDDGDEFLIVACDGVSRLSLSRYLPLVSRTLTLRPHTLSAVGCRL